MKRIIIIPLALALALALPGPGTARTARDEAGVDEWCGTRISTPAISLARHRFNKARRQLGQADRIAVGEPLAQVGPKVRKQLNVAVIEDDGTIFPPPNLFDLDRSGVQFKRGPAGTRAEAFLGGVSGDRGDRITIGDDASRTIDLPFAFNFFGTVHRRVFLNSDGNLTFGQADNASTARSLIRFLEGPGRIAGYFLDLDPSAASGDAGVYLLRRPGLVRITWLRVPRFGQSDANTFQITLFPGGRITIGFTDVDARQGIVGVSPGGPGNIQLVDFSQQLPVRPTASAIAERFRSVSEIDDMAVARAVLSTVRDEYDMIMVFADFPVDLEGAIAYHAPVKNQIRGIDPFGAFDLSSQYGSNGRLEGFIQMGSLAQYPSGPDARLGFFSTRTGITIAAHEFGHRWLSFARFRTPQGTISTDLLGRQMGHWSFLLDSDGSIMEGNDIRDNGDGTFTTLETYQGFSPLDLYLMGFRRPDEVPPFFYVQGSNLAADTAPSSGVQITGQRRNVNINQVISAMGPRVPNAAGSQKVIQVAVALLGRQGQPPSLASIQKANRYRNRLATYVRQKTGGRGRVATFLRLRQPAATAAASTAAASAPQAAPGGAAPAVAPGAGAETPRPEPTRRFDRADEPERR